MDNIVTFSFAVQLWESLEKRDNKQRILPRPLSFFEKSKIGKKFNRPQKK